MTDIETLHETRWLGLYRIGHWDFVRRPNSDACVGILAITPAREVVLVEQFRIPMQRHVIEVPAGLVGDEEEFSGESLAATAGRELLEETGYDAARMEIVAHGPPSPGLSSEYVVLVLARELTRSGPGGGVDGEDIVLHEIHLPDVPGWLAQKQTDGAMVDPKIFGGLWFAERAVGCP